MNYWLEIVVIVLLGLTVLFCWRLNNKIAALKDSRKDIAGLVKVFETAVANTQHSLQALKEASANAASDLKKHAIKSQELISELAFMNDTGVKIGDRLESLLFEIRVIEERCLELIERVPVVKSRAVAKKKTPEAVAKKRVAVKKSAGKVKRGSKIANAPGANMSVADADAE